MSLSPRGGRGDLRYEKVSNGDDVEGKGHYYEDDDDDYDDDKKIEQDRFGDEDEEYGMGGGDDDGGGGSRTFELGMSNHATSER